LGSYAPRLGRYSLRRNWGQILTVSWEPSDLSLLIQIPAQDAQGAADAVGADLRITGIQGLEQLGDVGHAATLPGPTPKASREDWIRLNSCGPGRHLKIPGKMKPFSSSLHDRFISPRVG
jgi:hypothetical protein